MNGDMIWNDEEGSEFFSNFKRQIFFNSLLFGNLRASDFKIFSEFSKWFLCAIISCI